jgi:DNA-binding transcriptional ArsR family regulator
MGMPTSTTLDLLKALSDQTRLDIVRRLVKEANCASCSHVSAQSPLSQPAMSHHFAKLVDAGVLLETKSGKEKIYELNTKLLQASGIDPAKL